ncbi:unnamed protein product [Prorocentrum cordatum]|uniref:Uncharacterized protein n=1 Tax=Prorocentrum cordatum TaxID=2364126 RepID=A0ABN9TCY3_9DINO|nr:unnamed protein product [Polarella glacialis]|mmetsp:Transcript_60388/g.171626  ORF Transcript_60388/g.171626 Transcript_60388/m.171626 type:complete len:173 (+) Transcript_60388:95-613(+)
MAGEGLPQISGEKTYSNKSGAIGSVVGQFFGQMGAFFGCFFGIKGPDGQWPHAWWSFCFFGNATVGALSQAHTTTAKIVRSPEKMTLLNLWGGTVLTIPISEICSIRCRRSCGCNWFVVETTDKFYEERRASAGCCKCVVGKNVWITCAEQDAFKQDHGLTETGEIIGNPKA